MRPKGSITGPLVVIALGVLFLMHAISPDIPIADWLGRYWPYILIAWGCIALAEVSVRFASGAAIPVNGVSGGAWVAVILICIAGLTVFHVRNQQAWWRNTDWGRGFDDAFGEEHNYAVDNVERQVGRAPHIVLENYRGDLKITGSDSDTLTLNGHKVIRAMKDEVADRVNRQTPVNVLVDGTTVKIQCNQNMAANNTSISTNLDLTVPRGASLEVGATSGDLDVSSLAGDVTLRSGNAGVRLQDLGGSVLVDTRRSDLVRLTNVKGDVELRGHGSDLELNKIDGRVRVNGEYTGTVSLRELAKPISLESMRTALEIEQIPGEVRLDRGSLNLENVTGPLKVNAHSTDVTLEGFSNPVEISVDRGDIDLKPGRLPLGKMAVHANSGNIELALPPAAAFNLTATTGRGQIENDFGDVLKEQTSGQGARLEGVSGAGPEVNLGTNRGTITIRRATGEAPHTTAASISDNRMIPAFPR